ncbi:MAG TPA: hypothetical protein G4O03_03840 [Dehalococcoidia bacterium]|nr:hypothetical protein [Dehalococcoidia bacterium]
MVLTYACLHKGAIEINLFAQVLLNQAPLVGYGAKAAVTVGICLGFWHLAGRERALKAVIACESLLIVFFGYIVFNNAKALLS